MTLDYNSLKRKIQGDLEIAKRIAKQEFHLISSGRISSLTRDYNSLKRKIQDDLVIAKRIARQELASEKILKQMKRAARRKRATQQMSNQVERINRAQNFPENA
jgi:hypothetical protein